MLNFLNSTERVEKNMMKIGTCSLDFRLQLCPVSNASDKIEICN